MKRYLISLVMLLFSVVGFVQGKEPMTFTSFFSGEAKRMEGALPVYQVTGKYYLEIPERLLGREMFFSGVVVRGGDMPYALTEGMGVAVFKLEPGHRVSLSRRILGERVSDTISGMYKLMSERILEPVDALYSGVA